MRHLPGAMFIVGAQTLPFLLIALRNKSHYVRRACMNYAGEPLMNEDEDDKSKELPIGKETEANLFKSRSIFIYGGITQELAQKVCTQLVALAAASDDDIRVYVNSPGGHVESGDSIHDMIKFIKPKVYIIGTGWVASAGALIYVSVPKERRLCLPNTRFLLHQPAGGAGGTASDIQIEAREILRMRDRLNRIFARQTGQPLERIEEDTHRDFWLTAEEAQRYGIVGKIIGKATELA